MGKYIYIWRPRSLNVEILNAENFSMLHVLEQYLDE